MNRKQMLVLAGAGFAALLMFGSVTTVAAQGGPKITGSAYFGDSKDDTVRRFDVPTGDFGGVLVSSNSGGLHGPRGMVFDHDGNLLVANQNIFLPINGEVLRTASIITHSLETKYTRGRHRCTQR